MNLALKNTFVSDSLKRRHWFISWQCLSIHNCIARVWQWFTAAVAHANRGFQLLMFKKLFLTRSRNTIFGWQWFINYLDSPASSHISFIFWKYKCSRKQGCTLQINQIMKNDFNAKLLIQIMEIKHEIDIIFPILTVSYVLLKKEDKKFFHIASIETFWGHLHSIFSVKCIYENINLIQLDSDHWIKPQTTCLDL